MKSLALDVAIDLSASASTAAFVLTGKDYPFEPGNSAVISIQVDNQAAGDAVVTVEGREDSTSSFTTLTDDQGNNVDLAALDAPEYFTVVLPQEIRATVVQTTGAGLASITLLQN